MSIGKGAFIYLPSIKNTTTNVTYNSSSPNSPAFAIPGNAGSGIIPAAANLYQGSDGSSLMVGGAQYTGSTLSIPIDVTTNATRPISVSTGSSEAASVSLQLVPGTFSYANSSITASLTYSDIGGFVGTSGSITSDGSIDLTQWAVNLYDSGGNWQETFVSGNPNGTYSPTKITFDTVLSNQTNEIVSTDASGNPSYIAHVSESVPDNECRAVVVPKFDRQFHVTGFYCVVDKDNCVQDDGYTADTELSPPGCSTAYGLDPITAGIGRCSCSCNCVL